MRESDAFKNELFSEPDLNNMPLVLTIAGCTKEGRKNSQSGQMEQWTILSFTNHEQKLRLNRTNWQSIAGLYGDESDNWPGKQIELFPTTCPFGSNPHMPCIRVRAPSTASVGLPAQQSGALPYNQVPQTDEFGNPL